MERRTHAYDGPLAVFLIGLRVHKPWKLAVVRQAFLAMPRMIVELEQNKAAAGRGEAESLGYLGGRFALDGFGVVSIQYWRSTEDICAYANSAAREHRPAWVDFYRVAKADPDAVTIWHETYDVAPHGAESMYGGPRPFGLADVAGTVGVGRRGETARERIGHAVPAAAPQTPAA